MAHGDLIGSGLAYGKQSDPIGSYRSWYALDAAGGTTNGVWIDMRGHGLASIAIKGIGTATAHVCASNDPTIPAASDHGLQLGADVTADTMVAMLVPVRWLKVRVSAWTSGTITAIVHSVVSGHA